MSTRFSIGQMNQLGDALEVADYTVEDVTKLRCSAQLAVFRNIIRGQVEIVVTNHLINLDAPPYIPPGWEVRQEDQLPGRLHGQFACDPTKIGLYLSDRQKSDVIVGTELRKALKNQPVLNANVLDYLLANPELIPEEWKGKYVFFWGTIYRNSDGSPYVRCLYWDDDRWDWSSYWLGNDWDANSPAAVLASPVRDSH